MGGYNFNFEFLSNSHSTGEKYKIYGSRDFQCNFVTRGIFLLLRRLQFDCNGYINFCNSAIVRLTIFNTTIFITIWANVSYIFYCNRYIAIVTSFSPYKTSKLQSYNDFLYLYIFYDYQEGEGYAVDISQKKCNLRGDAQR